MGDSETYITIEMIEMTAQNLESFIFNLYFGPARARLDLNWQNCNLIKARLIRNKGKKARPGPGPGKKWPARPWLLGPCVPSVPKAKLGHSNHVHYWSLYSGSYLHGLGSTILLGSAHNTWTTCGIGPKGNDRTLVPSVPSVPKAKLGHSNHAHYRFLIFKKLSI